MKQILQNMKDGKTTVEDVPVPGLRPGMALVKTSASLLSAGTERMLGRCAAVVESRSLQR